MSNQSHSTSSALLEQLVYVDNFMSANGSNSGDHTPNLDIDGQLSIDLAAFADDSFIFPDEDKPKNNKDDDNNDDINNVNHDLALDLNLNKDNHIKKETDQDNINNIDASFLHAENSPGGFQILPGGSGENQISRGPGTEPGFKGEQNNNYNQNTLPSSFLDNLNVSKLPKFPIPPGAKSSLVSAGLSQNQIDLLSALIAQHQTSLGNSIPSSHSSPDVHRQQVPHLPSQSTSTFNFNSPVRQHNQIRNLAHETDFDLSSFPASTTPAYDQNSPSQQSPPSVASSTSSIGTSTSTATYGINHSSSNVTSDSDKRRRNTAASARFRIKKKLKEKQMENQLSNLNDLIKGFEIKVQQLEMENKLLRNLIIEKGSQKSDQELRALRERARMG